MENLKVVVIDDEPLARKALIELLKLVDADVVVLGEAGGIAEAERLLQNTDPHVMFLDIEMVDGSGFDLLTKIGRDRPQLVFTTAYEEYALKAFKEQATSYLLKPIDMEELKASLARVRDNLKSDTKIDLSVLVREMTLRRSNRLRIRSTGQVDLIDPKHILYCSANGAYTLIHLLNRIPITTSQLLKSIHEQLKDHSFLRIDHATIVNMDHVVTYKRSVINAKLILLDGTELKVSRRRRKEVDERFK